MNLKNKIYNHPNGKTMYFLAGKAIGDGIKEVYLVNSSTDTDNPDYSLWYVEFLDDSYISLSPYDGENTNELIKELLEKFLETAFIGFIR